MGIRIRRVAAGLALALTVVLAGCGTDDGAGVRTVEGGGSGSGSEAVACKPVGDASKADSKIAVDLAEWSVLPVRPDASAGTITFEARNLGTEPPELVVVRAADPAALPKAADGTVDERQLPEGALIGEVEAFPAGQTCTGTFELAAGRYALFCNLLETEADGTEQNHYANGMHSSFEVRA